MKNNSFGISIVIPSFNRKEKLIRAINSIKSSHTNLVEIIVVDDNSDISPKIFLDEKNCHGINISIYQNSSNKGPQIARNLGIRRAKFNYIALLDSDDYFSFEKVDWLLRTLISDDIDFLYHAVEGCEKYNTLSLIWFNTLGKFIHFRWFLSILNPCVTPSVVFKKKICLFNPNMRYAEDYAFYLYYINKETTVEYINTIYSHVPRQIGTTGGISSNIVKMRVGKINGKNNILKNKNISNYFQYTLSLAMSFIRVFFDIIRKRYSIKDFIKEFSK